MRRKLKAFVAWVRRYCHIRLALLAGLFAHQAASMANESPNQHTPQVVRERSLEELEKLKLELELDKLRSENSWWSTFLGVKVTDLLIALVTLLAVTAGYRSGLFDVKHATLELKREKLEKETAELTQEKGALEREKADLWAQIDESRKQVSELSSKLQMYQAEDALFEHVRALQKQWHGDYEFTLLDWGQTLRLSVFMQGREHLAASGTSILADLIGTNGIAGTDRLKEVEVNYFNIPPISFQTVAAPGIRAVRFHHGSFSFLDAFDSSTKGGVYEPSDNIEVVQVKQCDVSVLDVSDNKIVEWLPNIPTMEELIMNRCPIRDDQVELIRSTYPNLRRLDLAGTSVTDKCVDALLKFEKLKVLNIKGTGISPAGAQTILDKRQLDTLVPPGDVSHFGDGVYSVGYGDVIERIEW